MLAMHQRVQAPSPAAKSVQRSTRPTSRSTDQATQLHWSSGSMGAGSNQAPVQQTTAVQQTSAAESGQASLPLFRSPSAPLPPRFVANPPVQLQRVSRAQPTTEAGEPTRISALAKEGIQGTGGRLPQHDTIARLFGRHVIDHVQCHSGTKARAATAAMGASGYAMGSHVAFASPTPSLRLQAHEAAHVVQQRAGVQLAGGIGRPDDAYERHADEVADAVVRGQSAEGILDRAGGGTRVAASPAAAIQRSEVSRAENDKQQTAIRFESSDVEGSIAKESALTKDAKGLTLMPINGRFRMTANVTVHCADATEIDKYEYGYIQTITDGWHKEHYRPAAQEQANQNQGNQPGKQLTHEYVHSLALPTPVRDAVESSVKDPFYEPPEPFYQLRDGSTGWPSMEDSPNTKNIPWTVPADPLSQLWKTAGRGEFRTWLVVRAKNGSWTGYLDYIDWFANFYTLVNYNAEKPADSIVRNQMRAGITKQGTGLGNGVQPQAGAKIANQYNDSKWISPDTEPDMI